MRLRPQRAPKVRESKPDLYQSCAAGREPFLEQRGHFRAQHSELSNT